MQILTLNTWGGRVSGPILSFFKENSDVDIFCLQEIYKEAEGKEEDVQYWEDQMDLFNDIQKLLPEHIGYFRPSIEDHYGLAIFIKKSIHVLEEGDINIYEVMDYKGGGNHSRNLQYIKIKNKDSDLLIANVHGLWNGQGKDDTPDRIN